MTGAGAAAAGAAAGAGVADLGAAAALVMSAPRPRPRREMGLAMLFALRDEKGLADADLVSSAILFALRMSESLPPVFLAMPESVSPATTV